MEQKDVEYYEEAEEQIQKIEKMGYNKLPVCIAKTQYSLSDDAKNLECNSSFSIHIKEVQLKAGAEFIVVLTGKDNDNARITKASSSRAI